MKKINFTKLEIKDITGKPVNLGELKLEQAIGNLLYNFGKDINIAELGKRIYNGEEIELRDNEIIIIKQLIESEQFPYIPLVKREVINFINN